MNFKLNCLMAVSAVTVGLSSVNAAEDFTGGDEKHTTQPSKAAQPLKAVQQKKTDSLFERARKVCANPGVSDYELKKALEALAYVNPRGMSDVELRSAINDEL